MKIFLIFFVCSVRSSSLPRTGLELASKIITTDFALTSVNAINPALGAIPEIVSIGIGLFFESDREMFRRYFQKILDRLDAIDTRLEQIEESVRKLLTWR